MREINIIEVISYLYMKQTQRGGGGYVQEGNILLGYDQISIGGEYGFKPESSVLLIPAYRSPVLSEFMFGLV
jgi:hypothetical protein